MLPLGGACACAAAANPAAQRTSLKPPRMILLIRELIRAPFAPASQAAPSHRKEAGRVPLGRNAIALLIILNGSYRPRHPAPLRQVFEQVSYRDQGNDGNAKLFREFRGCRAAVGADFLTIQGNDCRDRYGTGGAQ